LVETIVASTILFSCIAAAALSYNTAVNLTNKLNATIAANAALAQIQKEIKRHLFDGEKTGEQALTDGTKYFWQAAIKRSSPTILRQNDDITGSPMLGSFQVQLIEVKLTITKEMGTRIIDFPYRYKELIWEHRKRR
jgi:hypothetical protein